MLVLTRRFGQTIVIGSEVVVTILDVDRRGVRVGIEAPQDILVLRGELAAVEPSGQEDPE